MPSKTMGVVLLQSREAQEKQAQALAGMGEFRGSCWESKEKGKRVSILSCRRREAEAPL